MTKSVDELQGMLEERVKRRLAEHLDDFEARMTQMLEKRMEEIVCGLLGFDRSFGRWEFRGNDRTGIAISLSQLASAQVQILLPDALEKLKRSDTFVRAFDTAFDRHHAERLRYKMSEAINKWIEEESTRRADDVIKTLKTQVERSQ